MQKCKLCEQEKALRDSHIIPRFFYRFMQKSVGNQLARFDSTKNLWQLSNRQSKSRLFCSECEQLLSKNETEFSKIFHEINNQKPTDRQVCGNLNTLIEIAKNDNNLRNKYSEKEIYDAINFIIKQNPFYNKDDIVRYFAISYIFRELFVGKYNIPSSFIEKFRKYLYDGKSFDFLLMIRINNVSNFNFMTNTFVLDKLDDWKSFSFYVPNMLFHIAVHINDEIPNEFKELMILPENLLSDEMQVLAYFKKIQDNARIAQNLQEFWDKNTNQS